MAEQPWQDRLSLSALQMSISGSVTAECFQSFLKRRDLVLLPKPSHAGC